MENIFEKGNKITTNRLNCFEVIDVNEHQVGDCPNCGKAHYYWDYVLDEETYEEFFSGYYWENNR